MNFHLQLIKGNVAQCTVSESMGVHQRYLEKYKTQSRKLNEKYVTINVFKPFSY